ncbi:MAG: hypothetical protein GXO23_06610 [Crenarchaeota archaeon]|nr:hypothetical protein [Thermoproteota archaeon]
MYSIETMKSDMWRYTFTNKDFSTIPAEKYRRLIIDIQKLLTEDMENRKISAEIKILYSKDLDTHLLKFETEDQLLYIFVTPQGIDIKINRVGMKRYHRLVSKMFYILRDYSLILSETLFFFKVRVRRPLPR